MDIVDKLKQLAATRKAREAAQKSLDEKEDILECTDEWLLFAEAKLWLKRMTNQQEEEEDEVRQIAVQMFDGVNKKPVAGIEIKRFDTIKVTDEKKALAWASQNAPSLLKLDYKKFDKAVGNLELDFIEKGVEYRAQIASVLLEYLKDENV